MILRTSLHPELDAELVSFHGELDAASAPDLTARLDEVVALARGALVIDLCDCHFIDSLGIAVVVRTSKDMRDQGRPVAVAASSSQVRRVLSLTGADELLSLHWARDDAIGWLVAGGEPR